VLAHAGACAQMSLKVMSVHLLAMVTVSEARGVGGRGADEVAEEAYEEEDGEEMAGEEKGRKSHFSVDGVIMLAWSVPSDRW